MIAAARTVQTATSSTGRNVQLTRTSYVAPGRKTPEVVWAVTLDNAAPIYASLVRSEALTAFAAWAAL